MRFQKNMFLLYLFCLVLIAFLISPILPSAKAQLSECTCSNSQLSTCADGFRVNFLGQVGNTFTYSVCNEGNIPESDCKPPMDLSHADFIITNPGCIVDPDTDITTTIIGTDGQTTRACDAPSNKDKSCGVDNLSELLIKCDNTDGVFQPNPGQCIQVEIEVDAPGITVGPSLALNKAGNECGQGCLLGPSCVECEQPTNSCDVTVTKALNGSEGPASFDFLVDFVNNPPVDFTQTLSPPNTPSFMFQIEEGNQATITETMVPPGWMLDSASCDNTNICSPDGNGGIVCRCPDGGDEVATCTFTNSPPVVPQTCDIEIAKVTDPEDSPELFNFTSNQIDPFMLQGGGKAQLIEDIDLGVLVVVEEEVPNNWVLDNIVCEGGNQSQFEIDIEGDQLVRITCDESAPDTVRKCTFFDRFEITPIQTGCCLDGNQCTNDVPLGECSGTFDEGVLCGQGDCVAQPTGCCVEENQCMNSVLESLCNGTFGADTSCGEGACFGPTENGCCLEGDLCLDDVAWPDCRGEFHENTVCGEGGCALPPDSGCCFLDPGDGIALANRAVDPNKCVETNSTMCNELGGAFQGEGTMCTEFPVECEEDSPVNVPTLGQWGLIAMAGLLGVFSLFILIRRQKCM